MAEDTNVNKLIINYLTEEQYNEAKEAGTLNENELYLTPDDSVSAKFVTTQSTGLTCELPLDLHGQYTEAQCQKAALDYWLGYDSSSQSKYGANTETHDTANHRYKIVIRDYDTTRTMDYFYVDEWTLEVTSGWD